MLDRIQLSGDAAAGIIWLIIFVLWGIGKLLTAIRQQKIAKDHDASPGAPAGETVEDQLRKFLESMAGQQFEDDAPPRPAPPPPRAAVQPARQATRPAPAPPPFAKETVLTEAPTEEVATDAITVQVLAPGAALPGHEYLLGLRNAVTLAPDTSILLPVPDKQAAARNHYSVSGRDALQRAFMDRLVLGPPRGLSTGLPFEEQVRP